MNEETQKPSGLDEKKKSALIHYVAILFILAFIVVLLSMLGQIRNSQEDISALTESSVSALQKAEQLQNNNETLREENANLQDQIEALNNTIAELEAALEASETAAEEQTSETSTLTEQLTAAKNTQEKIRQAYEDLLFAMANVTPGSQEGNVSVSRALENLENLKQYLGQNGLEEYETLLEEGE